MKNIILSIVSVLALGLTGCANLDLNPPAEASTESWYKSPEEFEMAVTDLYRGDLWYFEFFRLWNTDRWSDDFDQQAHVYDWVCGSLNGNTDFVKKTWMRSYKGITRANAVIENVEKQRGKIRESLLNKYEGEARFFRACFYSYLIFLWGDVPYYTTHITIADAYELGRRDKWEILKDIYADFDKAYELLPQKSTTGQSVVRATAAAFKARTATWMNDYAVAADAAKKCIDSNTYSLDSNYERLFLMSTHDSPEFILTLPRSREFDNDDVIDISSFLPKNNGGKAIAVPSIELFSAFLCTDGLPIDKSPLFNPAKPFENRDPRLKYTCVEYGTNFLGFEWDPSKAVVKNYKTGANVRNNDSRLNQTGASWTGQILKKGMDEDMLLDRKTDQDCIVMRYADVLLMYAEAKIELGQIDQSVLDAMNEVRARAYKVNKSATSRYPAITPTDQAELRFILRMERRMELSWENRRWFDIVRWRLCEKAFNRPTYGIANKDQLQKNIKEGAWFFANGHLPVIEQDGLVDCSPLLSGSRFRVTMRRQFDPAHYLMPMHIADVTLLDKITQNPGY